MTEEAVYQVKSSYLEWSGKKITELNAEVRELKIRLKKAEGDCIHTWIPFVSDKIYLQCSKCGVVKIDE